MSSLAKLTQVTYIPPNPGDAGEPASPAIPDQPGYWAWETTTEVWYEEQIIGYDQSPLYSDAYTDANGVYHPPEQIGVVTTPRYLYVPFNKEVTKWVWHPPKQGVPANAGRPAKPPTEAQFIVNQNLGWNAGAYSIETAGGNAIYRFQSDTRNIGVITGLTATVAAEGEGYAAIAYGFYLSRGHARVVENGQYRTDDIEFADRARFAIQRIGRTVYYRIDDRVVYTSAQPSDEALLRADASLYCGDDEVYAAELVVQANPGGTGSAEIRPLLWGEAWQNRAPVLGYGVLPELVGEARPPSVGSAEGQALPALWGEAAQWGERRGWAPAQELPALTSRSAVTASGQTEGQVLPALVGIAAESGAAGWTDAPQRLPAWVGRASGPAGGWAESEWPPLNAYADGRATARGWSDYAVLPALTGGATTPPAGRGDAQRLPVLRAFGWRQSPSRGTAHLPLLIGGEGRGSESPADGHAAASEQRLGALQGRGWQNIRFDTTGDARLSALTSVAQDRATGTIEAALPGLHAHAWEDRPGAWADSALPRLAGQAEGPNAARQQALLPPLRGYGYQSRARQWADTVLPAVTGRAGCRDALGLSQGRGACPALDGAAADRPYAYHKVRLPLPVLTGSAEGGWIRPDQPVWGAAFLSLIGYGHAVSGEVLAGEAVLPPLEGMAADRAYTWTGPQVLPALRQWPWSGALPPPPNKVERYIPRLLLSALGQRQSFGASLPLTVDAVLTGPKEPLTLQCDARIARPRTLLAAVSAEIAVWRRQPLAVDTAVAKTRTRHARANAWLRCPQTLTASLDAVLES